MKTEYILGAAVVVAVGGGILVANSENEKIKKFLGKSKKEDTKVIPPKKNNVIPYNPANGISARSPKVDIMRLQNALIAAGHLAPTQKTRSGKTVSSADGIWGNDTNTALAKAGLSSPVTEAQLNSIKKASGGSNSNLVNNTSTYDTSVVDAVSYMILQTRENATDYGGIRDMLIKKEIPELREIAKLFKEKKGISVIKQFSYDDNGGLVTFDPINNAKKILQLFQEAGVLSGLGDINYTVRTKQNCIIEDPKKGSVVVDKNVILGKVVMQNADGRLFIETVNGGQIMANAHDVVSHQ